MQRRAHRATVDMVYETQKERCEALACYTVEHNATVRQAAHAFSVSKSTVHKDLTTRLRYVNPALFAAVREVLARNKSERHLRGGEATRQKYKKSREERHPEKAGS